MTDITQTNPVNATPHFPKLMKPRELAKIGPLSEYAIRKGLKDGTIPYIKIGNAQFINVDKLQQILEEC